VLRPQVADFEDPIAFLDAWMTWKKRTFGVRPNTYSQRMFARDAGRPKQTSLFSHILSGRRPLRGDVLEDTIRALALPTDEEQVLRHLTVPPSERSASTARRLEGARARARARYAQCEARFLSSWQHLATWELAHLDAYVHDASWVGRQLDPPLPAAEARIILDDLVEVGLLDPRRARAAGSLFTPREVPTHVVDALYRGAHQRIGTQLERLLTTTDAHRSCRFGLAMISFPQSRMEEVVAMVDGFKDQLVGFCEELEASDQVMMLGLQLVPVAAASATDGEGERGEES